METGDHEAKEMLQKKWKFEIGDRRRFSSWPLVHHQVLKIREEESHIGEEIGEGLSTKEKAAFLHLSSQMDALFYSRPLSRSSSPLGLGLANNNNTAIRSFH